MIEAFVKYLTTEKARSEHTVAAYRNDLEDFFSFLQVEPTEENVVKVTTDDVRSWAADMMSRCFLARSVNRKLSSARSFYRFLRQMGVVEKNPAEYVPALKTPKPLPDFFKESEVEQALQLLDEEKNLFEPARDNLIIEIFYQTGMRRAELANLKDVDVDFSNHTIRIFGKGRKERIVPFGQDLELKIKHYQELRARDVQMSDGHLFVRNDGSAMRASDIYNIVVKKMGAVSTLEKHSPHVLRHTFATTMLNHGADIDSVKELLGHASLATTQIYTHVTFEQMLQDYSKAHPRAKKEEK
ncbi:MAG: tyrosine-type recombinase/integrase [Paludibacteraceae bacterium]|nr:tyrosine-type recombinase/integrase [Paludibacteraceae bacterium]